MTHLLAQNLKNPAIVDELGNLSSDFSRGGSALSLFIANLISLAFGLVGLVLLIMLLRGGYQYITAGGDKDALQKSVKTMTTAFIGAVILLSTFAIIQIVEVLFGISLRNPHIPKLL